jgi:hypothetical protein
VPTTPSGRDWRRVEKERPALFLEPPTADFVRRIVRSKGRCFKSLDALKKKRPGVFRLRAFLYLVARAGFEPTTFGL